MTRVTQRFNHLETDESKFYQEELISGWRIKKNYIAVTSSNVNEKTLKLFAPSILKSTRSPVTISSAQPKVWWCCSKSCGRCARKAPGFHFWPSRCFNNECKKKHLWKTHPGVKNASKNPWLIFMEIEILIGSWRDPYNGLLSPTYGCFRKAWYPQIIHFNRVFHYFHHPFRGVSPILGNIHITG